MYTNKKIQNKQKKEQIEKKKEMRGAQTVEFLKSIHPNSKALICQWAVHWYYLEREEQRSEPVKNTKHINWLIHTHQLNF